MQQTGTTVCISAQDVTDTDIQVSKYISDLFHNEKRFCLKKKQKKTKNNDEQM